MSRLESSIHIVLTMKLGAGKLLGKLVAELEKRAY